MPTLIQKSSLIPTQGPVPKRIEELVGRVNTGDAHVSIARMEAAPGWTEPGQRPDFEELSIVLSGCLEVEYEGGHLKVAAGETLIAHPGEWIRYSSQEGASYLAICLPAFSIEAAHRDPD